MDDLNGMDPEQLQQLMQLGSLDDKLGDTSQQMRYAQAIRRKPIPKGGMVGRVYVADPFGAAVGGLEQYKNTKDINQLKKDRTDIYGQQAQGRNVFLDLLRKKGGMQSSGM